MQNRKRLLDFIQARGYGLLLLGLAPLHDNRSFKPDIGSVERVDAKPYCFFNAGGAFVAGIFSQF